MEGGVFLDYVYNGWGKVPRSATHVRLDSSVTEIQEDAFEFCNQLVAVDLNEGLQTIGSFAFHKCTSLRNITFPSTLEVIEDYAFFCCKSLENLEFPTGLLRIGKRTFHCCELLKSVVISSSIKSIGQYAFSQCFALESLQIHRGSLDVIERSVFFRCDSLRRVILPSSVRKIEGEAFADCRRLMSVELPPQGLEEIEDGSFVGCHALQSLCIPSTVIKVGKIFGRAHSDRPPSLLAHHQVSSGSLIKTLKTRFDGLPIHELCYYQAHYPTTATFLERLQQQAIESSSSDGGNLEESVDMYGMTPFHIIALSAKLDNINLVFQELLKYYSSKFVYKEDVWGKSVLHYMVMNDTAESDAVTKQFLQAMLTVRIDWLGLQRWRDTVMDGSEHFPERWVVLEDRYDRLALFYSKLAKYEKLEVLSLIEMFLWSMKMDEAKSTIEIIQENERQSFRINCGADIIISNVLPYLDNCTDAAGSSEESSDSEGDDEEPSESTFVFVGDY